MTEQELQEIVSLDVRGRAFGDANECMIGHAGVLEAASCELGWFRINGRIIRVAADTNISTVWVASITVALLVDFSYTNIVLTRKSLRNFWQQNSCRMEESYTSRIYRNCTHFFSDIPIRSTPASNALLDRSHLYPLECWHPGKPFQEHHSGRSYILQLLLSQIGRLSYRTKSLRKLIGSALGKHMNNRFLSWSSSRKSELKWSPTSMG